MPEDASPNGSAPDGASPLGSSGRVLEMQAKLHRWAMADPGRVFDDLFNLVHDPATLSVAFDRVAGNQGARTAGVDGLTAFDVERDIGTLAFLDGLRSDVKSGRFRPLPVRERKIPKPGGSGRLRSLGIPTVADRTVQAALKLVLEPIFEADFLPVSYGFRPKRRAQDAIAEIQRFGTKGYLWVLDADIEACFDSISHPALMDRVRARVKDKRVLTLVRAFLKAGIMTESGDRRETHTGTPQGGIITPPTQWATRAWVTLRSVLILVLVVGGAFAYGDAVPDGDLFGADEDVFDQQSQHVLTLGYLGARGLLAELGEESFEVVGEFEVGVAVGELGFQGVELAAQVAFACAQVRHPGAQFIEGDQLFLERFDHAGDRGGGFGQGCFEAAALAGGRIAGAGAFEALVDLGSDQLRVGDQGDDVVPDEGVEVVGADGLVGADPAAFVAVVVGAQAPVVVDLLAGRGGGRGAVVAVSAAHACRQALQEGGDLAVARGEALVVGQALGGAFEGGRGDERGDGDRDPLLAGPVGGLDGARGAATLQAGPAVQPRRLVQDLGLAEGGRSRIGGVAEHAPDHAAVPAGLAGAGGGAAAGQPAGQVRDGGPVVGIAAEQLHDQGGLGLDDLVAGPALRGLAQVSVAEGGAAEHVDGPERAR